MSKTGEKKSGKRKNNKNPNLIILPSKKDLDFLNAEHAHLKQPDSA